jgi:hypothetical protein
MSLLTACTEASPGVSYFAPAGGGGGGGGSTLQSPASITPDVALGDSSLSLTAQGVGNATLSVSSPVVSSLPIYGATESRITLGNLGSTIVLNTFNDGIFSIRQGANTTPALASFDVVGNVVNLGNSGSPGSVLINTPLTYTSAAGAPKAAFPPIVLNSTAGPFVQGDNTIALGGLAPGLYAMYGDTGGSTVQADLDSRFNSIVQINPAFTCSGGAGGADTGWNLSPNGTGGLTLNLTNAPTGAFSVKAYPIYLF